jgi:hypothetical protein
MTVRIQSEGLKFRNVIATATSRWILAVTASRWILAATTSSQSSRSELQHSSPTFDLGILIIIVGTSSWRVSPTMGNVFVDDTDTTTASTFAYAVLNVGGSSDSGGGATGNDAVS